MMIMNIVCTLILSNNLSAEESLPSAMIIKEQAAETQGAQSSVGSTSNLCNSAGCVVGEPSIQGWRMRLPFLLEETGSSLSLKKVV